MNLQLAHTTEFIFGNLLNYYNQFESVKKQL